jgi:hypothetical protein
MILSQILSPPILKIHFIKAKQSSYLIYLLTLKEPILRFFKIREGRPKWFDQFRVLRRRFVTQNILRRRVFSRTPNLQTEGLPLPPVREWSFNMFAATLLFGVHQTTREHITITIIIYMQRVWKLARSSILQKIQQWKWKFFHLERLWNTITWLERTLYWTRMQVSEGKAKPIV